jgi:hypothetical protein
MKYFKGDLLESDVDVICHVANLYHTFGSGIAYYIKKKYPEAYQADLDTDRDCETKLGTYSKAMVSDNKMVYNLYAMSGIGNDGHPLSRNLSYDHFYDALFRVCYDIGARYHIVIPVVVGVPKYIGCARAGGDWDIVEKMINNLESKFTGKIEFHIYELEEPEFNPKSTLPV